MQGKLQYFLEFVCIMLQYVVQVLCKIQFVTKNDNSWELLLTDITDSFALNVTGLLDLILKGIDKFRL